MRLYRYRNTRQGKGDKKAIGAALDSQCPHIRMIVNQRKMFTLKEQLVADGKEAQALSRLEVPAGIHIEAKLPNEIALSVLAEVIQLCRTSTATPLNAASATNQYNNVQSKSSGDCCGG